MSLCQVAWANLLNGGNMVDFLKTSLSRRAVLGGGLAAASTLALPSLGRANDRSLKVAVYGGYFKDSFDKHIFPEFTKQSGIAVEAIASPASEAWLIQLQQAAKAGNAPADVSMMSQTGTLRGLSTELWTPIDAKRVKYFDNILSQFVTKYPDGRVAGIGAVAWFFTLVTNTNVYPTAPDSWAAIWDKANKDKIGLQALYAGGMLEATATTFLGGTDILDTEEGLMKALEKLAEAKPNVALWYRDEAQFQQQLKAGEIPMGQYYHDVTGLAAAQGQPLRSTFPKEGGIQDSGSWVISRASKKADEAHVFIDYMSQPSIQALMSRKIGTAPTLPRDKLDLTAAEFSAVSSEIKPIIPRYDLYISKSDWLSQKWTEMIVG